MSEIECNEYQRSARSQKEWPPESFAFVVYNVTSVAIAGLVRRHCCIIAFQLFKHFSESSLGQCFFFRYLNTFFWSVAITGNLLRDPILHAPSTCSSTMFCLSLRYCASLVHIRAAAMTIRLICFDYFFTCDGIFALKIHEQRFRP